jgi:ribosome maturation factor RimP
MTRPMTEVSERLAERVAALGFELVDVEWAGSRQRPVVRLRIDVPTERARAGESVSVGDCAGVSRGLEPWLDGLASVSERYVLEVSSPGVDRPLTRPGDFDRFVGSPVAVRGNGPLAGRARRLEGELLGRVSGEGGEERVRLRLASGEEVEIPREEITGANLVFRWS